MKKIHILEYITYMLLVILIIIIASWNSLINPSDTIPRIIPTIIYNIPLLILMVKLKKNQFSTYIMMSYIMLLYFVAGIGNTTNKETFVFGIIISFVSLSIFLSSILYVREKKRISS
jgi:uncharacterized membrane protein